MNRLDRWLSVGLVLTLGFLLGILGFSVWDKMPSSVDRITWSGEAQWIAPQEPSYSLYARRTFYIADTVQAAWLRISADNDFILYVNGQNIAQEISTPSHSLALASDLQDPFQGFNDSVAYRFISPEWIHLSNTNDWKLTVYTDLAPYLHPGKNTIALEIQKSQKKPRVVVQGVIYQVPDASPINLTTGATPWQVSTLSETRQSLPWFDPDFPDGSWPEAKVIGPVKEATYSRLSQHLFDRLLQGTWITGTESPQGEVWLRGDWQVPKTRQRAFIRLAGDGEYALLINGVLVKRFGVDNGKQLHMYEVTNFLKTGHNTLAVRLARPLDRDWSATQHGSLGFFLDGWVETHQNSVTAPIATDSTWSALSQPLSGWDQGFGSGQKATILRPSHPQEFHRHFEGNAYLLNYPDYLLHQSLWLLAGMGCAFFSAWGLGRFWLGRRNSWWHSFGAGAGLLSPGTLFLIGIGLLKHRYAEAERGLLFVQPQSTPLIFLGFVGVLVLTLLLCQMGNRLEILPRSLLWCLLGLIAFVSFGLAGGIALFESPSMLLVFLGFVEICAVLTLYSLRVSWSLRQRVKAILQAWPSWGQWFFLVLIVGIGFGLRVYNLDFRGLEADESTSLDATRGILRTGSPELTSDIWYTRSPAFHYMLALWLRLFGDSIVNARFVSVIWGTATLVLVFIFTRQITGKAWIALVVTAILAIDPMELWYSRFIRFYQAVQFMSVLSFWLFCKGFIDRCGRVYQYVFFIALTLMLLTQEVTVTLLPCFLIGFLLFYRSFFWSVDWPIVLSSLTTVVIYIYDGIFFSIKCLTPLLGISSSTDAMLKLHLYKVTGFTTLLFVGTNRINIIYGVCFFLGFIYFINLKNKKMFFLFESVFLSVILMTILVYQNFARYVYPIYPLFIMLAVYSAIHLTKSLGQRLEGILKGLLPLRNIALVLVALLLFGNIQPDKVLAAYGDTITVPNVQVAEYIREHRLPGDVVISGMPGVYASVDKLDYYLPHNFSLFDTIYIHEGRLIDRWSRGVLIDNLDQTSHVLENAQRVWIQINPHQTLPKNSKYADLYNYLETLGQPVIEAFGVRLRLWKREDGLLPRVPNQGQDLGVY